jgi:predicted NBD/HSP70 family sugar kinase
MVPQQAVELPLAFDIGATHMRAAVSTPQTGLLFARDKTPAPSRAEESLRHLLEIVDGASDHRAVGVSRAAGLDAAGTIAAWPSRPDWLGLNLITAIERATACSTIFHLDDGMAAALWEYHAADFEPRSTVATLSIGTGLGVGIVHAGKLVATGDGAETLGHAPIGIPHRSCRCGRLGCLQATLSDPSLPDSLFVRHLISARRWLFEHHDVDRIVIAGGGACFRNRQMLAREGFALSQAPDLAAVLGAALFARINADEAKLKFGAATLSTLVTRALITHSAGSR